MKKNKLGGSDLEISQIAFGTNIFGWTVDEITAFKLLDTFIEKGGNFLDTADVYPQRGLSNKRGESESIIGKWLKYSGKRNQLILATKVGIKIDEGTKDLSKKYIFQAVDNSLKRLQTDYIDLYQSHIDDFATPLEETLDAYKELIAQGKVRVIGASNYSAKRLSDALITSDKYGYPRYQSVQPCYNHATTFMIAPNMRIN